MDEPPTFGAWLKRRRKALDLTQDALARLVGCSVVSIRKFESDTQRPSRQLAERLAARQARVCQALQSEPLEFPFLSSKLGDRDSPLDQGGPGAPDR